MHLSNAVDSKPVFCTGGLCGSKNLIQHPLCRAADVQIEEVDRDG